MYFAPAALAAALNDDVDANRTTPVGIGVSTIASVCSTDDNQSFETVFTDVDPTDVFSDVQGSCPVVNEQNDDVFYDVVEQNDDVFFDAAEQNDEVFFDALDDIVFAAEVPIIEEIETSTIDEGVSDIASPAFSDDSSLDDVSDDDTVLDDELNEYEMLEEEEERAEESMNAPNPPKGRVQFDISKGAIIKGWFRGDYNIDVRTRHYGPRFIVHDDSDVRTYVIGTAAKQGVRRLAKNRRHEKKVLRTPKYTKGEIPRNSKCHVEYKRKTDSDGNLITYYYVQFQPIRRSPRLAEKEARRKEAELVASLQKVTRSGRRY